jgi:hypothetical protein
VCCGLALLGGALQCVYSASCFPTCLQGDINEAARNLSALPGLQELGLYNNELTGRLGDDSALCQLAQGSLEMLQLGGMGLTGSLPACLFDGNSTLYQVGGVRRAGSGAGRPEREWC